MPAKPKLPGTTSAPKPDQAQAPWEPAKYLRIAAVGIIVVVVAVAVAYLVRGHKKSPATTQGTVTPIGPTLLTASGLKTLAHDLHQVIYWVGPVAGDKYELTRTTTNEIYLRYLPHGVKAGTKAKYLLVATYPLVGALESLLAANNGQVLTVAGGKGGLAAVEKGKPTNVRVAFPGIDFQMEIYDPSPRRARTLATSAALTRVP